MKVIVINGVGRCGKDTFVELFKKEYEYRCENYSTIDYIKQISADKFGWDGKKNDKSRKFLSDLKKLWTDYNNGPFNNLVDKIKHNEKYFSSKNKDIIYFIHCREPEEIQKFVDYYKEKCITLLIERNVDVPDNYSDNSVYNFNYDYTIENNGTIPELTKKAKLFITKINPDK